jgi:catechol 2,3-dioxygenase-like lactoylglutathione lyase family enzyme
VNGITGLGAISNLDYAVLLCDDLAAMRRFYTEVMGFEVHHEIPEMWVEFQVGASLFTLRPRGQRPYDGPRPAPGAASVQLAFRVPPGDVATAAAQLAENGVEILEGVTDQPFGHRTLFFADPEHNVVEVYAEI